MEKIFNFSSPLYKQEDLLYLFKTEMDEIFTDDYLNTLCQLPWPKGQGL